MMRMDSPGSDPAISRRSAKKSRDVDNARLNSCWRLKVKVELVA